MLNMTLMNNDPIQRNSPSVIGIYVAVLTISFVNIGCVARDCYDVHIMEPSALLSQRMPNLGPPAFPDDQPYPDGSFNHFVYRQGFIKGWQIIQDAGQGALVVVPQEYAESRETQIAWNYGLRDGKKAGHQAYLSILQLQPSLSHDPSNEKESLGLNPENSRDNNETLVP